jgi:flavin-dependent dehydrogenase
MYDFAAQSQYDVVILGGGLAGLTLSLQLKQKFNDLKILVLERRKHPVPLAAHKVGESSVEIGAYYFEQLGLKDHLKNAQLKKFGFRFFFSDGIEDITAVTEFGCSKMMPTTSYQIDRGIFENMLGKLALESGIHFVDGATVRNFTLSESGAAHEVKFECDDSVTHVNARWLVDACGRAALIKRKLGLSAQNGHNANAVWFRISDRIDVNDWSNDAEWLGRCTPPDRWRSTNHFCGDGYWVWLIPLASGSHSVGIVCDAEAHPIESMNTFERAMTWLQKHQPLLYKALDDNRDQLQDFAFFKRFSYGCKQVFSGKQRWALTGEAGLFLDPFYSPGSDFIAIANTYITELIVQDRLNRSVELSANVFEQVYFSFYENMLTLYQGQYKLFGDPEVLPIKFIWDTTLYWGVMCQFFFQNRLTDIATMSHMRSELANIQALNKAMQKFFRKWGDVSDRKNPGHMIDQASLPWFRELNRGLTDKLTTPEFSARMKQNLVHLAALAKEIIDRSTQEYPELDTAEITALMGLEKSSSFAEETLLFPKTV